ncbi:MAG: hypothetical protein JXR64_13120, partial [Spirochaetales bacterium]|nr:hypothetical protein [Spirochaetales bacterium]
IIQNPKSKKDWITIHFSGFICFMIILFTTGIDVFLNTTLTWSLFSSASTIYIYLQLILIINLKKNPFILYGNSNLLLGIFLFILDLLTPGDPWFAQYVLPCFISLQILSIILYIVFKNIKLEFYRTIITILTVNILLILINRIISNKITWAAITSSIAIPISIFLFYINYKIRNRENSHSTN